MELKYAQNFDLSKLDMTLVKRIGYKNAGEKIRTRARRYAPKDTHSLQNSIGLHPNQPNGIEREVRIWPRNRVYARIQELGGVIRPRRKKVLSWQKWGKRYFAKQVTIKPKRYMRKAFVDWRTIVPQEFEKAVEIVANRI